MAEPLRLFVLAGEASGDRLGADLVERLRKKIAVQLTGVGGNWLTALGLSSMFPMRQLAVMGWADVLPRLPLLLWRARQVAQAIVKARPDVVVLIDAQEFSRAVARQVRAAGSRVPMLLYVAPSVWAWKPERAAAIRPLFDEILAILPFEPPFLASLNGPPASYVGHPALARSLLRETTPRQGPVLLLPGSRDGELRRHLPIMKEMARRFQGHPAVTDFAMPTVPAIEGRVRAEVATWQTPVAVVTDEKAKAASFQEAVAAVAVTGTVTLELALAGVPMVTTYVSDAGQDRRYFKNGVKYIALPNVILDRPLVPEVLGRQAEYEWLGRELELLLSGQAASAQLAGFKEIRALMESGASGAPRTDPAERVLALARP